MAHFFQKQTYALLCIALLTMLSYTSMVFASQKVLPMQNVMQHTVVNLEHHLSCEDIKIEHNKVHKQLEKLPHCNDSTQAMNQYCQDCAFWHCSMVSISPLTDAYQYLHAPYISVSKEIYLPYLQRFIQTSPSSLFRPPKA